MSLARTAALVLACASLLVEAAVEIRGLDDELTANVRGTLSLSELPENAAPLLIENRMRRAASEIRQALQPYGHYQPTIKSSLRHGEGRWTARFDINAGPVTTVREVRIVLLGDGAEDRALLAASRRAQQALEGTRLLHSRYDALRDALHATAYSRGHIDAEFTQRRLLVDPEAASARVEWALDTGPRFRFGAIMLEPAGLDEDVLRRYVNITPGQTFDADRLLAQRLRLTDLGYFETVEVIPERDLAEDHAIPIRIRTTPRLTRYFRWGVGWGSDTGPRLSGETELRRLNRRGHRLRSQLRLAQEVSALSGQYLIPAGREPGEAWTLGAQVQNERLGTTRSNQYQLRAARNFISGIRLWQSYINYEHEEYRLNGAQTSDLLIPGLSLTLQNSDDRLLPTRGYRLFLDVHGASHALGSTATFLQTRALARTIVALAPDLRLLLRAEVGVSEVDEFSELPPSQRFFAGGDRSVRGYDYRSIGPRDRAGEVIGGRFLLTGSAELDWIFWRDWGLAAFFDAGGASDEPAFKLSRGVGIGARWRTPVGMLRFDFARPLDSLKDAGLRIHVGLGADL